MVKQWIVVADESRARIFARWASDAALQEIETLTHPAGRMRAREMKSDRPGRSFDSQGKGRHAMSSEVDPERQEAIRFADKLAERLETARTQGEYGELVLVAPPVFLGALRKELSTQVRKLVVDELAKELTSLPANEIESHLSKTKR